ncbi:MAG: sialidase family protein [Planctomycetota bacterium]
MLVLARPFRTAAAALFLAPLASAQWQNVSPPGAPFDRIQEVAVDPTDALHVVARDHLNLYESIDGGSTWAPVDTSTLPSGATALALTIDGDLFIGVTRPLELAPGTARPLLFRRTSTGWSAFGPEVHRTSASTATQWTATDLAVGRGDPDRMALVVREDANFEFGAAVQYFLSDDGGATWTGPTPGFGDPWSLQIVERPEGPAVAAILASYPSTGTIVSYERSSSWGAPTEYIDWTEGMFTIALPRTEPGRMVRSTTSVYSFDPKPLERSDDLGSTWTATGASDYYWSPRVGAVASDLMLRSTTNFQWGLGGIEISWNGGSTWQALPDPSIAGVAAPSAWTLTLAHDDTRVYASNNTSEIFALDLVASTGAPECAAQPNATGRPASIRTFGSTSIAADEVRVHVDSLPPGTAALLLASRDAGFVAGPGGSFGDLCLGGAIGRFGVTTALPTAEAFFDVPVGALPTPTGPVAAQPGESWRFQAWFRDNQAGAPGSNFTDAVAVTFEP